jgi:hypothetical protein
MSRDGMLPPGCAEKDVDESAPGHWDEPMEHHEDVVRVGPQSVSKPVSFGDRMEIIRDEFYHMWHNGGQDECRLLLEELYEATER